MSLVAIMDGEQSGDNCSDWIRSKQLSCFVLSQFVPENPSMVRRGALETFLSLLLVIAGCPRHYELGLGLNPTGRHVERNVGNGSEALLHSEDSTQAVATKTCRCALMNSVIDSSVSPKFL